MEKKINLTNFIKIFETKKKIELHTIAFALNIFTPTLVIILVSFFGNYDLVSELSILIGTNIIFTQIFSSNSRALIIKNKSKHLINFILKFRIIISIILILINFLVFLKFQKYSLILLLMANLIIIQWINEIVLTFNECFKKNKIFYKYISASIIFSASCLLELYFLNSILKSLFLYNIFIILILLSFFYKNKLSKSKTKITSFIFSILKSDQFFSSFSISFANLFWRILIIYFCGKIIAGIYFAGYAIGSLPGSLFNNTFGPRIIKENIRINPHYLRILKVIFIILLIFSIFTYFQIEIFKNYTHIQIFCSIVSALGSYFMTSSQIKRQKIIQNTKYIKKVFKVDILYSLLVITLIPSLFFIGGVNLILFSFLILSIISWIIYSYLQFRHDK